MSNLHYVTHHSRLSYTTTDLNEEPPWELINEEPPDWSGRAIAHVDYERYERLPFELGKLLGAGINGPVYKITCDGVNLALKRISCRRKMGAREKREIEIIKRLSHDHIIRLVGTFTQGRCLGLLLWPVAICDLATFLEDVDWLQSHLLLIESKELEPLESEDLEGWVNISPQSTSKRITRLTALGVNFSQQPLESAVAILRRNIGCIACAVAYLHASDVKHKDLKSSNILLSGTGLWLTDFGTSTDFSVFSSSVTENGERGTPKYFAPEVANRAPSGRSADIFSMGCVFFEIMTLCMGYTLESSEKLRELDNGSFQANLANVVAWLKDRRRSNSVERSSVGEKVDISGYLLDLVRWMMEEEADVRPTADAVEDELGMMNSLDLAYCQKQVSLQNRSVYRSCCHPETRYGRTMTVQSLPVRCFTMEITMRRRYIPGMRGSFDIAFSSNVFVESVHIFSVSVLIDPSPRKY